MNAPLLNMAVAPRAPILVPDQGIRIDDRFAGKLVSNLVDLIKREETLTVEAVRAVGAGGNSSGLYSVKAQRRWFEKVVRAAKFTLLSTSFSPGNRRKFSLMLMRLATTKSEGEVIIVCNSIFGGPTKIEQKSSSTLRLPAHLLQRLIQRGGITSVDDLVAVLRHNMPIILLVIMAFPGSERSVWAVPLLTPAGLGRLILRKEPGSGGRMRVIAKTFTVPSASASARIARLTALHERMVDAYQNEGLGDELIAETVALLDDAAVRLGAKEDME